MSIFPVSGIQVVKNFGGTSSQSSTLTVIPVVNLSLSPSLPAIEGSIVYDTNTQTVIPYTGSAWATSSVVNTTTVADLPQIGQLVGCTKTNPYFAYATYSKVGNSVHITAWDNTGDFATTATTQTFGFSLPYQTTSFTTACGTCSFSTPAGSCTGHCGVSVTSYGVGTASQSGTTVTGAGTTFVPGMIGGTIVFTSGQTATVTGYTSATSLTVSVSQTVPSGTYNINYSSGFVWMNGPILSAGVGQLVADFTYFIN